jgi:hypothetical protein
VCVKKLLEQEIASGFIKCLFPRSIKTMISKKALLKSLFLVFMIIKILANPDEELFGNALLQAMFVVVFIIALFDEIFFKPLGKKLERIASEDWLFIFYNVNNENEMTPGIEFKSGQFSRLRHVLQRNAKISSSSSAVAYIV